MWGCLAELDSGIFSYYVKLNADLLALCLHLTVYLIVANIAV